MLEKIKSTFDKNNMFTKIVAMYLNEFPCLVTEDIMTEITGGNKELDDSGFCAFLSSAFIEDRKLEREMEKEYFTHSVKKLDPMVYENDPYYKNIKIPNKKIKNWTLGQQKYAPYEGFIWKDLTFFDGFKEVCNIGYFDREFFFPTVFENGVEWMAIKPNEIETMRDSIKKARGRVAVFGLGLGYYAYMVSEKEEVSSVTVIERDESVIELFKSEILPQFKNRDKIKIIKIDALDFIKKRDNVVEFDYAFIDLWHDTSDGTDLYMKLKKMEANFKCPVDYWIEDSILSQIRKRIFYAIYDSHKNGKNTLTYNEIVERLSFNYIRNFVKFI